MKIKFSQAQNNWYVSKEVVAYKREECADLRTSDMNTAKWFRQQLSTVIVWDFFLLHLSLLKVIPEVFKWYQST